MAITLRLPRRGDSDDELAGLGRENPGYRFEREENGDIVVSPTHTKGGAKSSEAFGQLRDYKKQAGGSAYDSSTGFAIGPGKRVYSPDAAWIGRSRIDKLRAAGADNKYWPIAPDIVIEVKSDFDDFAEKVAKIAVFIERGSTYGVAIDPATREVVESGQRPAGLALDFGAIIDA